VRDFEPRGLPVARKWRKRYLVTGKKAQPRTVQYTAQQAPATWRHSRPDASGQAPAGIQHPPVRLLGPPRPRAGCPLAPAIQRRQMEAHGRESANRERLADCLAPPPCQRVLPAAGWEGSPIQELAAILPWDWQGSPLVGTAL
jgi:hypothetical protein